MVFLRYIGSSLRRWNWRRGREYKNSWDYPKSWEQIDRLAAWLERRGQ